MRSSLPPRRGSSPAKLRSAKKHAHAVGVASAPRSCARLLCSGGEPDALVVPAATSPLRARSLRRTTSAPRRVCDRCPRHGRLDPPRGIAPDALVRRELTRADPPRVNPPQIWVDFPAMQVSDFAPSTNLSMLASTAQPERRSPCPNSRCGSSARPKLSWMAHRYICHGSDHWRCWRSWCSADDPMHARNWLRSSPAN